MSDEEKKWHERRIVVNEAKAVLSRFLLEFNKGHKLTTAEYISLFTDEISSTVRSIIAQERVVK